MMMMMMMIEKTGHFSINFSTIRYPKICQVMKLKLVNPATES